MRAGLLMLGGLLVWGGHFTGVYAIASLFDLSGDAGAPAARSLTAAFSALCLAANLAILALVQRPPRALEVEAWMLSVARLGAAFSAIAITWQALPAAFAL